jgi:hypothetical protein
MVVHTFYEELDEEVIRVISPRAAVRPQVNYVFVAIHWVTSRSSEVSPETKESKEFEGVRRLDFGSTYAYSHPIV